MTQMISGLVCLNCPRNAVAASFAFRLFRTAHMPRLRPTLVGGRNRLPLHGMPDGLSVYPAALRGGEPH